MTTTLIRGKYLVTRVIDRHKVEIIEDGAVLQKDGIVVETGTFADLEKKNPEAKVLGGPGLVLMPGFVNGHHHVGLTPLQLGSPDYALELWFASRFGSRRPDLYLDTLYSAFEMIESGITTVQHIHGWMPGGLKEADTAANAILKAYDAIGMRASYCYAVRDQNRLVYEPDEQFVARLPAQLQPYMTEHFGRFKMTVPEYMTLFESLLSQHAGNGRLKIQLAPANFHWCDDSALEIIGETSRKHNAPMHMHLNETIYQKEYARRRTGGGTAFQHLHKLGITGPLLTLGHGVWLNEDDIALAAETGTCVCHNCSSNFRLRSGIAPLNSFEKHGVTCAIGLDEAGINDDRDMLNEMRLVLRAHRVPGMEDDDVPSVPQVLRMATEHGAMTTPFGASIGALVPGRACDLVAIDWQQVAYPFLDPDTSVIDAVVQRAKTTGVRFTMCAGEVIYEDGKFTKVDKEAALAELAGYMARPLTEQEVHYKKLGKAIFPHVKKFYDGYLDGLETKPFYTQASSI